MVPCVYVNENELEPFFEALGNKQFSGCQGEKMSLKITPTFLGRRFDFVERDFFQVSFDLFQIVQIDLP